MDVNIYSLIPGDDGEWLEWPYVVEPHANCSSSASVKK